MQGGAHVRSRASGLQADVGVGLAHLAGRAAGVLPGQVLQRGGEVALRFLRHRIPGAHVGDQPAPVEVGARGAAEGLVQRRGAGQLAGADQCRGMVHLGLQLVQAQVRVARQAQVGSGPGAVDAAEPIALRLQRLGRPLHRRGRGGVVLPGQRSAHIGQRLAHVVQHGGVGGIVVDDPALGRLRGDRRRRGAGHGHRRAGGRGGGGSGGRRGRRQQGCASAARVASASRLRRRG